MRLQLPPVTVAGAPVEGVPHICALCDSVADEQAVVVPFAAETIAAGERLVLVVEPEDRASYVDRLEAADLDVDALQSSEQLVLLDTDGAYLPGGVFDVEAILGAMRDGKASGVRLGYPRTRSVGRVDWILRHPGGVDVMPSFEARATDLLTDNRQPTICVYRTDRIDPHALVDAIRAHPSAVVEGSVWTNPVFPFFVPADDRLAALRPAV